MQKRDDERTAKIATREAQARDAALATKEYHAEKVAIRLKTERLRALRLAKEAGAAVPSKSAGGRREKS